MRRIINQFLTLSRRKIEKELKRKDWWKTKTEIKENNSEIWGIMRVKLESVKDEKRGRREKGEQKENLEDRRSR